MTSPVPIADAAPAKGIAVQSVARSFGPTKAVRDASFTASFGAVTGLIGPNGSGKTTLMLMLASLLQPDSGSIRIAGHDPVQDARAVRREMGWMPDVLGSWSNLSVRTTLELTGRLHGMPRAASRERADELTQLVGLGALANQPTRVLSRGQKQRLSLARSIVHDPQVLLLDEPASGLDPAARVELRGLVRSFAAAGKCVLVTSHVLAELEEMVDTAVYLDAGVTVGSDRVARARAATRDWRIRALDPAALATALVELGEQPSGMDRQSTLVPMRSEAHAAEVLARLVTAGVQVSAFAPAVGELEQTFLDLQRAAEPQPRIEGEESA